MKTVMVLLLLLIATSATAGQFKYERDLETAEDVKKFEFRGDFVETYMAERGFLDTIPPDTKLSCGKYNCSGTKSVRMYVFKDARGVSKSFWSTDLYSTQYDDTKRMLHYGREGHIVYYDETNQIIYRSHVTHEATDRRHKEIVSAPVLTYKQLSRIGSKNEAIRAEEIEGQERRVSESDNPRTIAKKLKKKAAKSNQKNISDVIDSL